MNMLGNYKVGTRLGAGFGVMLVTMILLTIISLYGMASIQNNLDRIVKQEYAKLTITNSMNEAMRFQHGGTARCSNARGSLLQEKRTQAHESGAG